MRDAVVMKVLQVLGAGCPKCKQLAENTEAAAKALGIEYQLEKVTDIKEITSFGVVFTPALAVNGEVKVTGKVPGVEELQAIIAG
jgi:small redox-active disulfide protein 2